MKFKISGENARNLDKILNTFMHSTLTVNVTKPIVILQTIQDDKSLILNMTLNRDFFMEYETNEDSPSSPLIFSISRTKFYRSKMKELVIRISEYLCTFTWFFADYRHTLSVFVSETELYKIDFNPVHSVILDYCIFFDILKHFNCKNLELKLGKEGTTVSAKDKKYEIGTHIPHYSSLDVNDEFSELLIEVPCSNLKKIFKHVDLVSSCSLLYENPESPINIVCECVDFVVSFFSAVYS